MSSEPHAAEPHAAKQASAQTGEQPSKITNPKLSIFVVLAGSFFAPVMYHSTIIAIPALSQDLQINATQIGWYTYVMTLGNLLLVIPGGKVGDIYGHKRFYCMGILLTALGCFAGAMASNAEMLLAARFFMGLGMAFVWSNALALVNSIPPKKDRPKIMSVYTAITYSGMVSGPILGGLIIQVFDWRAVFLIPGLALSAIAVTGLGFLKWEHYGDRAMKLNYAHTGLYVVAVACLGSILLIESSTIERVLLSMGITISALFLWLQSRSHDPLLQTKLFTQSLSFTALALGYAASYISITCIPFSLTLLLSYALGMSEDEIGLIIMTQASVVVAVSLLSVRFISNLSGAQLILSGASINCLGVLMLSQMGSGVDVWFVVLTLLLLGSGVGLMEPSLTRIALATAPSKYVGSAAAILASMRILGGAIGMGIISMMIYLRIGSESISQKNIDQLVVLFQSFYTIGLAIMIMAFLLLVFAAKRRRVV